MILHWDQLVLHYGAGVGIHRPRFEEASQTTYGLLCCRYSPAEDELGYSAGAHAEANLPGFAGEIEQRFSPVLSL